MSLWHVDVKPALTIRLAADERHTLLAWQRSTTIPAGRARRGRIILLVADGVPISHIADTVGISRRCLQVGKAFYPIWR